MSSDVSTAAARPRICAMPEAHDAIRFDADDDEPPALLFNDQARPGALVSWAWGQLSALDTLLAALSAAGASHADAQQIASSVRTILVPAMNALKLSEQRAFELRLALNTPADRPRPARSCAGSA